MTDGQRHRHVRTDGMQMMEDGRPALVFRWSGRSYGPTWRALRRVGAEFRDVRPDR